MRPRPESGETPPPDALERDRRVLLAFLEAHPRGLLALLGPLDVYRRELLAWSARAPLVSRSDLPHIFEKHVIPALSEPLLDALDGAVRILDFGSGAGLPGIPIALALGASRVTLLEARRKKALFLRRAVEGLGLISTEVLCARSEDLAHDPAWERRFDRIVARASGTALEVWRRTEGLRTGDARLLAIKGSDARAEAREAEAAGLLVRVVPLPHPSGDLALLDVSAR